MSFERDFVTMHAIRYDTKMKSNKNQKKCDTIRYEDEVKQKQKKCDTIRYKDEVKNKPTKTVHRRNAWERENIRCHGKIAKGKRDEEVL